MKRGWTEGARVGQCYNQQTPEPAYLTLQIAYIEFSPQGEEPGLIHKHSSLS